MMAAQGWVARNWKTYFQNAVSLKDFRSQLRGNRAQVLWGLYLAFMISIGALIYWSLTGERNMSVAQAQDQLRWFYTWILGLLGTVVMLVAPVLTATAIPAERQNQSFDLLFSSPLELKHFLVGKMISSFRFTAILLFLSLPIASICVLLGGATWTDISCAFLSLLAIAIILTAFSILISSNSQKSIVAIMSSYGVGTIYFIVTIVLGMSSIRSLVSGRGAILELPFFTLLNPFGLAFTSNSFSIIGGYNIPNWILLMLFALAVSKLCLLAAASNLCPGFSKELVSLRIHSIAYSVLNAYTLSVTLMPLFKMAGRGGFAASAPGYSVLGQMICWIAMPILFFFPIITCHGREGGRRFLDGRLFSLPDVLRGSPAGSAPFLLLIILGTVLGGILGALTTSMTSAITEIGYYVLWLVAIWFFMWSLGRLASSLGVTVKAARAIHMIFMVVFVMIIPMFVLFSSAGRNPQQQTNIAQYVSPFGAIQKTSDELLIPTAAAWGGLGLVITVISEFSRKKNANRPPILKDNARTKPPPTPPPFLP